MKTVLLFITLLFSALALTSCTNEEGDNDLDFLTPEEEENQIQNQTQVSTRVQNKSGSLG
ncbi:hypothetical protein [Flagellimonas myxillae]|uniref:hypothetical protein n=1 Tax=Flagellimonas myxillae TaxID=2942214 RepID=UPI00201F4F1E|nr:hypothetical protein [Muricauda myxillae]MCL6265009.1 hypothetical protein [Muricauda myxillae]